jgi:uncharacterized protein (DUF952 family)
LIYHLVWEKDWLPVANDDEYRPASLATEGFVHATKELFKLEEVANLFYNSTSNGPLLVLLLDEQQIDAPIRYEDAGGGHLFPHVYGPIPQKAVVGIEPMQRRDDGWGIPPQLEQSESSF